MNINKIKTYLFEILLIVFLFFALFKSNIISQVIVSIALMIVAILSKKILKKRTINSIYQKQVTITMTICSIVYLLIFYSLGLYFDFVKPKIGLSLTSLINIIIPLSVTIISSEIIRKNLLSQDCEITIKGHKLNISLMLTYIIMVLIDLVIYTEVYDLTNIDDFLKVIGYVIFASLSCNLLYNYVSIKYGYKGIIIYRLITILYVYILPVMPDIYIFFRSFYRMIAPYLIYLFLEKNFSKKLFLRSYKEKSSGFIGNTIAITIMVLLIMLISCQFKYGMIVIGSHSMTGTLNKGDAIIYEQYNNHQIKEGQIIIFDYNGLSTIHRVVEIKKVNGEIRYYTKGDANKERDVGYSTREEIIGLVNLRIKYLGYPTLWFRSLFE